MARSNGATVPAIDQAREILRAAVPKAAEALVACLDAEDLSTRLRAAAAILNRAGLTEADKVYHGYANKVVGGVQEKPVDLSALGL